MAESVCVMMMRDIERSHFNAETNNVRGNSIDLSQMNNTNATGIGDNVQRMKMGNETIKQIVGFYDLVISKLFPLFKCAALVRFDGAKESRFLFYVWNLSQRCLYLVSVHCCSLAHYPTSLNVRSMVNQSGRMLLINVTNK